MRQYGRDNVEYDEFYSAWMKRLARMHGLDELRSKLCGNKSVAHEAGLKHLKQIQKTSSMQGNSAGRAHARNSVAAAGAYSIALEGAIEIHELFPEEAKQ